MYIDRDESIRFIVEDDVFEESEPPIPGSAATGATATTAPAAAGGRAGGAGGGTIGMAYTREAIDKAKNKRKAPFRITGSIAGQGLGVVRWWLGASDYVAGEGDEEMAE